MKYIITVPARYLFFIKHTYIAKERWRERYLCRVINISGSSTNFSGCDAPVPAPAAPSSDQDSTKREYISYGLISASQ